MSQHEPSIEHELLETLKTTWASYPDLRLTQLIVNAINPSTPCPEIFHVEDSQLIEKLKQLQSEKETLQDTFMGMDSNDNIKDLLKLQQEVIDFFESSETANQWIYSSLPALGGEKPIVFYKTSQGRDRGTSTRGVFCH